MEPKYCAWEDDYFEAIGFDGAGVHLGTIPLHDADGGLVGVPDPLQPFPAEHRPDGGIGVDERLR